MWKTTSNISYFNLQLLHSENVVKIFTSVYAIIVSQNRFDGLGMVRVAHKQTHSDIGSVAMLIDKIVFKNMNR